MVRPTLNGNRTLNRINKCRLLGTLLFRLIPAIALMDGLYGDDQDEFECLTTQPGCKQMCFNTFSPILHHRLWCLNITILMIPTF